MAAVILIGTRKNRRITKRYEPLLTKINAIQSDWVNIKNKCRTTVNKAYSNNEATPDFKSKLLIAEHSPIRLLTVDWSWILPSYSATHFSRHKWECFIGTQRSDRTGVDRHTLPQDVEVPFDGVANAQNLIDTARKRLCFMADPVTRSYMEDLKRSLRTEQPELSDSLVPNCVYRCGCPEFQSCGRFNQFMQQCNSLTDIDARYKAYNVYFYGGDLI